MHKASVRGFFIQLSSILKKACDALTFAINKEYEALATKHTNSPSSDLLTKLEQAHMELNICLATKTEKQLQWTNDTFITWRDRPGSLLAHQLTPRHSLFALPKIRLLGGHISQDPQKILQKCHNFYADLYGQPLDSAPSSIKDFLGNLPLLSIYEAQRELMDQPFTDSSYHYDAIVA